jgi:hypothetical protein
MRSVIPSEVEGSSAAEDFSHAFEMTFFLVEMTFFPAEMTFFLVGTVRKRREAAGSLTLVRRDGA